MSQLRKLLLLSAIFLSGACLVATSISAAETTPPAQSTAPAPQQTPAPSAAAPGASAPAATAEEAPPLNVDVADLMAPGKLPEIIMGDDKAPVTIVEYHSMTCPHCSHFAKTVLPTLEDKYIKTGKVRLVLRAFPLNQLDAVAFLLLRCRPTDAYVANVKYMYDTQQTWAYSDHPKEAVMAMAQKIGFTQETFETCLKDDAIWDGLREVAKKADETFKVDGTPAFFINGTRQASMSTVDDMEKALVPFIKN